MSAPTIQRESVRKERSERSRKAPPRRAAQERLLEAGTELLAEGGLEGANSNQIARAAGVGVGTFYAHFADKHALHRAIVRHAYECLQARLSGAVPGPDQPVVEQVRFLVGATVAFAAEEPALFRVAFGQPAPMATPGEPALAFSTRAVEHRLAALQRAGDLDPIIDPEVAARGFMAMQTGVMLLWLDGRLKVDRETLVETLTRLHPALAGAASPDGAR